MESLIHVFVVRTKGGTFYVAATGTSGATVASWMLSGYDVSVHEMTTEQYNAIPATAQAAHFFAGMS